MKEILLRKKKNAVSATINIGGSKSESNRLLILNALYDNRIEIENLSDSDDSFYLQKALIENQPVTDVHHAGTAMRFLIAYYAIQKGKEVVLTGSKRMKQRPVGILTEALKTMGASVKYLEKDGYPPLKIKGNDLNCNNIELSAGISSQFISALMMIAPKLKNGLEIRLDGKITSESYIKMTAGIMKKTGIDLSFENNLISIKNKEEIKPQRLTVESDWSSASYFYSVAALSEIAEIKISSFRRESLQGDSEVSEIYKRFFGVETEYLENQIIIRKNNNFVAKEFEIDLNNTPDLAQTIAVTAAGLKIKCKLNGLETLKVKETDRLLALKTELEKLSVFSEITEDSISLLSFGEINTIPRIKTYQDHRMAMSFAALSMLFEIEIEEPEVVSKSYPNFWLDFEKL